MRILWMMTVVGIVCCCLLPADAGAAGERILKTGKFTQSIESGNWQVHTPDTVRMSGAAAIRFLNDHGGLEKSKFPYIYGKNPLLSRVSLPLNVEPGVFNEYNQLSCWVYPDKPDRAAIWFEISGSGVWTQACWPLKPRQWNKISICWSNNTPEQARQLNRIYLARQNFGRLPGDAEWSDYRIRDFVFEKVDTGSEYEWEPGEGMIIVSQTGFAPGDAKTAIVNGKCPDGGFELLRENEVVHRGKLLEREFPTGRFKVADFSDWKAPGIYTVKIGEYTSPRFEIGYGHLKELTEKNRLFLYCMRSGTKTPAHPECFLDDCVRSDNGEPVDVSGGWFDASDLRSYHSMAMKTILRPLAMIQDYNVPSADGLLPSVFDEMLWGAKQLDKLWDEKTGLPFTVHSLYPLSNPDPELKKVFRSGHFYKVNNYWTDNRPGTGDERAIHAAKGTYLCHPDQADSHWGMTAAGVYFYLAAEGSHPELARSVLKKSKAHFDFLCESSPAEQRENGVGAYNPNSRVGIALRLENAIALWRATGKSYYRALAHELAGKTLELQQLRLFETAGGEYLGGFFQEAGNRNRAQVHRDDMTAYNLARMSTVFADDDRAFDYHAALRIYADFFLKNPAIHSQPYHLPYQSYRIGGKLEKTDFAAELGRNSDGEVLYGYFADRFISGSIGSLALQSQIAAMTLNDLELQKFSSECLRYFTGENPGGRSLIAEVGSHWRGDIMSSALGWIPGMMGNPDWKNGIPGIPYHRHHGSNEIYTQTQAVYSAAAILLHAPARLTLNMKNIPSGGMLTVHDLLLNRIAAQMPLTESLTLELPGGVRYRFEVSNGASWESNLISGEKRVMDMDLEHHAVISDIQAPARVQAGQPFKIEISLAGRGKARPFLRGRNLKIISPELSEQTLPARFTVEAVAELTDRPYVIMATLPGDTGNIRSAAGAVR
jgi:hypothetical protein